MAPKPPKPPKKVKRDASNGLGLIGRAFARVRVAPQSVGHLLGLHQGLSAFVAFGAAAPDPIPGQGWDRAHTELFVTRESARGRNEELLSAVLLCLQAVDSGPPETVHDAAQRLEAILRGTTAADRVAGVLGQLRPGLRLTP